MAGIYTLNVKFTGNTTPASIVSVTAKGNVAFAAMNAAITPIPPSGNDAATPITVSDVSGPGGAAIAINGTVSTANVTVGVANVDGVQSISGTITASAALTADVTVTLTNTTTQTQCGQKTLPAGKQLQGYTLNFC